MKGPRSNFTLVSSLLASAMAIGMAASAQPALAQDELLASQVKIPFDFQAGSKTMPAGTYTIQSKSQHPLLLRDTSQKAAGFVMVLPEYAVDTPSHSSIVFDKRSNNTSASDPPYGIPLVDPTILKQLRKGGRKVIGGLCVPRGIACMRQIPCCSGVCVPASTRAFCE